MVEERRSYRLGPRVRGGVMPGIRNGQAVLSCVALVIAVGLLRGVHGRAGGPIAIVVAIVGLGIAWLPIAGANIDEWVPVLGRHMTRKVIGAHRVVPRIGATQIVPRVPNLSALGVVSYTNSDRLDAVGVIRDRKFNTASAVLAVGSDGLGLSSELDQDRRVEIWSNVLASLANARGLIHRLQWIHQTAPDHAEELRARIETSFAERPISQELAVARDSYRGFVERELARAYRHETFLVVTVSEPEVLRRAGSDARTLGRDGVVGLALSGEISRVQARCRDAGLRVSGVLSEDGLGRFLRRCTDDPNSVLDEGWPWPLSWEEHWSALRTDGSWHATYWILDWPRNETFAGFLSPMLLGRQQRPILSVVMAPVAPARASRAAEYARTSAMANNDLRHRHGFALTSRVRREQEGIARREHELAEGHGAFRFSGYVTVSARTRAELGQACDRVEQSAAQARVQIRRLFGLQGESFCCSLPIGRGRA